jgi:hypothetical protein
MTGDTQLLAVAIDTVVTISPTATLLDDTLPLALVTPGRSHAGEIGQAPAPTMKTETAVLTERQLPYTLLRRAALLLCLLEHLTMHIDGSSPASAVVVHQEQQ